MDGHRIEKMLQNAGEENRLSQDDWQMLLQLATAGEVVVANGWTEDLLRLVARVESGIVAVEGMSHRQVLQDLEVFV